MGRLVQCFVRRRMASKLKTDGTNWSAGDDLRVIDALLLPFSEYTQDCVGDCCNALQLLDPSAVTEVRTFLQRYEDAEAAIITQDNADTEGKTLVKADVLEWEKNSGGMSGLDKEMIRARDNIRRYFSSCTCLAGYLQQDVVVTQLYRS